MSSGSTFKPFAARGRRPIVAILVTIAIFSVLSVVLSISETARSEHRGLLVEVAARQRTLTERYVNDVLLARSGSPADHVGTATVLKRSARALLDGGKAPEVEGDADAVKLPATTDHTVRAQLEQARGLVQDLTATGAAILSGRRLSTVKLTGHEHVQAKNPIQRLRLIAALTSNVSLNAARAIATEADRNVSSLIRTQVVLGVIGLLISVGLVLAVISAVRRQTAHFRSLVTASNDLVLVFGEDGCRYASKSVADCVGATESELLGDGFMRFVHEDDRTRVLQTCRFGLPSEISFRIANKLGEWRRLEARVSDLRDDRDVRGVVLNARDNTERLRLEAELTRQAFHDTLTGLANRALFRDRLNQAVARSVRSSNPLAVLLIAMDRFKQVNESLGHSGGDELLRRVAERIDSVIRPSDTLARFGGDEFALLLEGATEEQALNLAGRLLAKLAEPIRVAGHDLTLGASIGMALHSGGAADGDELIRNADVATYVAKERGRGRFEVFTYEMSREFGDLLGLEQELRTAVEQGQLNVHYQPEVSLQSGEITGVEALLRWQSISHGPVSPGKFIPLAEKSDLIYPLGEFVLGEACRQAAEWRRAGILPDSFVTWVNVSGKQVSAGGLTDLVRRELDAAGLPANALGLEVTETAVISGDTEQIRAELEELRARGVHIAIDDFGTGFSSLSQLREIPLDLLKVDQSFVAGAERDVTDAAIIANLVNLAHTVGVRAIAEGIETEGQLAAVRAAGCELGQGFHFSRPMPPDQIPTLLADRNRFAARLGEPVPSHRGK